MGTGEDTKQDENSFDLVTFGSSFNVCDRELALKEVKKYLSQNLFSRMWNHNLKINSKRN